MYSIYSLVAQLVKKSACNPGDTGSTPGLGRYPGGGHGDPLQHSCLENSMDGGTWWEAVHGVTNTLTQMSIHTDIYIKS